MPQVVRTALALEIGDTAKGIRLQLGLGQCGSAPQAEKYDMPAPELIDRAEQLSKPDEPGHAHDASVNVPCSCPVAPRRVIISITPFINTA
jgi:hypothetical protein